MIFNYKYLAYLWSLVFFEGDVISDVLKYGKGVSSDASWKMLYLMTQTIAMMKSVMTYSLDRPLFYFKLDVAVSNPASEVDIETIDDVH